MFASKDTLLTRPSGGYTIARSVRLRSSASAYFNRTPASAGNQQKFTWSGWVKRGAIGQTETLFGGYSSGTQLQTNTFDFRFNVDYLDANWGNGTWFTTTAVYRDPSAWYHIVLAVDTTQATASNRMILYVNGVIVTSFSTASYPAQNTNLIINTVNGHAIGKSATGSFQYFDGYMTEINFVDGQQLTPSSFGSTNAITGVWQPIKYTGTYGTNGFYLNFSDNSSNTSTTIGKDYSGNGNNWTPNNISVTAGTTYDSMVDSPTVGATSSNYCVVNPLDNGGLTITQANLAISRATTSWVATRASFGVSTGKWYWEYTSGAGNVISPYEWIGIGISTSTLNNYVGYDTSYAYAAVNGNKMNNNSGAGTGVAYGSTYTSGDVIGVALDCDAGTLIFYKNNTSQGTAFTGLSGTFFPMFSQFGTITGYANFGQRPFSFSPPSGYVALNTFNLP